MVHDFYCISRFLSCKSFGEALSQIEVLLHAVLFRLRLGVRCCAHAIVSMRKMLVLPLSPVVVPPVMTTVVPGARLSVDFAQRSA